MVRIALAAVVLSLVLSSAGAARAVAPLRVYPPGTHTGVPGVDRVLDAIDSGKAGQIAARVGYFKKACSNHPSAIPPPPPCREGEPEGTLVDVFATGSCEGDYVRRDQAVPFFRGWLAMKPGLYAAYRCRKRADTAPSSHEKGLA